MSETTRQLLAVGLSFIAGLCIATGIAQRARARERRRVRQSTKSNSVEGLDVTVRGCACQRCKNVVWAQRTDIEPLRYCAYCGQQFIGVLQLDDFEFSRFVVED